MSSGVEIVVPAVVTLVMGVVGGRYMLRGKRVDAGTSTLVAQVAAKKDVEVAEVEGETTVKVARVQADTAIYDKAMARIESLEKRHDEMVGRHIRERQEDAERRETARATDRDRYEALRKADASQCREDAARVEAQRMRDAEACRTEITQLRGEVAVLTEHLTLALSDRDAATARSDLSTAERGHLAARCELLTTQCAELTQRIGQLERTHSNPGMPAQRPLAKGTP